MQYCAVLGEVDSLLSLKNGWSDAPIALPLKSSAISRAATAASTPAPTTTAASGSAPPAADSKSIQTANGGVEAMTSAISMTISTVPSPDASARTDQCRRFVAQRQEHLTALPGQDELRDALNEAVSLLSHGVYK
jgi:hypothetical protein